MFLEIVHVPCFDGQLFGCSFDGQQSSSLSIEEEENATSCVDLILNPVQLVARDPVELRPHDSPYKIC